MIHCWEMSYRGFLVKEDKIGLYCFCCFVVCFYFFLYIVYMSKTQKLPSFLSINTEDIAPIDVDEYKDVRSNILKDLPVFDEERLLKEHGYVKKYMNKLLLAAYKEGLRRGVRNVTNPYSITYRKQNLKRGGKRRTIKSKNRRF